MKLKYRIKWLWRLWCRLTRKPQLFEGHGGRIMYGVHLGNGLYDIGPKWQGWGQGTILEYWPKTK